MSDKFQIGCRTFTDETCTAVRNVAKPSSMDDSPQTDVVIRNKIGQPVIELLSSDDKKPSSVEITVCNPSKLSIRSKVSKSNTSQLRMEYNAYRERHYSLPSEERNGRAMNMQEYIWNSIEPETGDYEYDSQDSRDMKMKEIFERNKVSRRQFLEGNETKRSEENQTIHIDQLSTTSSNDPKYRCTSQNKNDTPTTLITFPTCVTIPKSTPSYVTHYPDWYAESMRTNSHDKEYKAILLNKDWLTDSLREEIMALSLEEILMWII